MKGINTTRAFAKSAIHELSENGVVHIPFQFSSRQQFPSIFRDIVPNSHKIQFATIRCANGTLVDIAAVTNINRQTLFEKLKKFLNIEPIEVRPLRSGRTV